MRSLLDRLHGLIVRGPQGIFAFAAMPAVLALGGYHVHSGDTLSSIAASHGVTVSELAHQYHITNPNLIYAGKTLARQGSDTAKPAVTGKVWGKTYGYPYTCGDGDGDGWDLPCSALHHASAPAPAVHHYTPPRQHITVESYSGNSSLQSCIIARESGGNAHAVNPTSGAGGLYQFLPSTWHALGYSGAPQDASVATQNAAYAKEVAIGGSTAWSAYDGC